MKIIHTALTFLLVLAPNPVWCEDLPTSGAAPTDKQLLLPGGPDYLGLIDGDIASLRIGNRRINVEIASTPQGRERGLMQRDYLCEDCGMLFIFDKASKYSFWMKDTLLPLIIAFIAADGSVINIEEMQPNTTNTHAAQGEALYALEMNRGWFAKNSIAPASKMQNLKRMPKMR